jgi:hypothetical protein
MVTEYLGADYIEIPCTGKRAKTSAVTEATSDNYINHDGKVSGRSNQPSKWG